MGSLFSGGGGGSGGSEPQRISVQSHPLRRSTTDIHPITPGYHNSFPNASTPAIPTSPPAYDSHHDRLPPSRFKILPREEEGREELPKYTCSLHKEAVLDRKMELRNPFERARKRNWSKCYILLHGTKLDIHKAKKIPFPTSAMKADTTRPVGWLPGTLLESYTLQLAQVGAATDYKKKTFVIRLRVQTEQFLLSCSSLESFVEWFEVLSAAVDLSPPLDERSLPRYQTLPRRRRRQIPGFGPEAVQDQDEIFRRYFPDFARGSGGGGEGPALSNQESISNSSDILTLASPGISPIFRTTSPSRRAVEPEELDHNGKWAPRHALTPQENMRLARRCVAELFADAPRQSDFIVDKGQRFKLLYESKEMVPDDGRDMGVGSGGYGSGTAGRGKGKGKDLAEEVKLPRLPEYEEVIAERQGVAS
ncbi:PH domain-like protein [Wilcoxina mikolae CBS 423.85]|nr:PH domain-like protein [Wilcoxina mikolae CBS 423.85]